MDVDHPTWVAANLAVVRRCLELFDDSPGPKLPDEVSDGLKLVDEWLAERTDSRTVMETALEIAQTRERPTIQERARNSRTKAADWLGGAIIQLCLRTDQSSWVRGEDKVVTWCKYVVDSLLREPRTDENTRRREALLEELNTILAKALQLPPLRAPERRRRVRKRRPKGLDRLGQVVSARFKRQKAWLDPKAMGDSEALSALLKEVGHRPQPHILTFEEQYGGIVMEDVEEWRFGVFALLSEGVGAPQHDPPLVPIACSSSDIFYYLDDKGAAWVEDLETPAPLFTAPTADAAVAQIVLLNIWFDRAGTRGSMPGAWGALVAQQWDLPLIEVASHAKWKAWATPRRLVIEDSTREPTQTLFAGAGAQALKSMLERGAAKTDWSPE